VQITCEKRKIISNKDEKANKMNEKKTLIRNSHYK
jgi:hypothetical protein